MKKNKSWSHDANQYSVVIYIAPHWKGSATLLEGDNVRDVIEKDCLKYGIDVKTVLGWTIEHTVV